MPQNLTLFMKFIRFCFCHGRSNISKRDKPVLFLTDGIALPCQPTYCASSAILRRRKPNESAIIAFIKLITVIDPFLQNHQKLCLIAMSRLKQKITVEH